MSDLLVYFFKVCAAGGMAEIAFSFGLLELSNYFVFDIPRWSLWLAFGGPPVCAALTFIVVAKRKRKLTPGRT